MLYLVETDVADISHLTPEELTTLAEESVIPSMEALNKLQLVDFNEGAHPISV